MKIPRILIDQQEKHPLAFPVKYPTHKQHMKTGDYSLEGLEDRVLVERKSINDLCQCLTKDIARFERQLQRLSRVKYRCVVVESTLLDMLAEKYYSRLPGWKAMNIMIALQCKYKIPFYTCGAPHTTMLYTLSFLQSSFAQIQKSPPLV